MSITDRIIFGILILFILAHFISLYSSFFKNYEKSKVGRVFIDNKNI